jgi:hypothetical protein
LPFIIAAWDNTLPADNDYWDNAAGYIRNNWDALEVELGIDLTGAHPYYQAAAPTQKPDESTTLDANDLGRIWIDSDDDRMYVLTAVTPTWTDYPSLDLTNTWVLAQTFSVPPTWTLGTVGNNTYLTATDNAGTGTVDLIKADTNDVMVIPDDSQTATSGAPTFTTSIANKAYVDLMSDPEGDDPNSLDSNGDAMVKAQAYLTQTSGFVTAWTNTNSINPIIGYVDTDSDPVTGGTVVGECGSNVSLKTFISFFVGNGKYFEITQTGADVNITWTPLILGGGLPVDQD